MREIEACRPWLMAEIGEIDPEGIVCLGATAAQALIGKHFRITKQRGEMLETELADWIMATYHPSAVLRMPDEESKRNTRELMLQDLRQAAERIG